MSKEELLISDYLAILVRRKWVVVLLFLVALVATDWWARQETVSYRSRARFKVQRQMSFAALTDWFMTGTGDPIVNYVHEVTSYVVARNAAARLVAPREPTHEEIVRVRNATAAQRIERSDIVEVSAIASTPREAADRCDAVVKAFIDEHDRSLQKNAREVLESIEESYRLLIESIKQRESQMVGELGHQLAVGSDDDMLAPLRLRVVELELQLQELRLSGNYTEDYADIVRLKNQIEKLQGLLQQKVETEFERRVKVKEYDRFRQLMDEKASVLVRQMEEARIATDRKSEIVHILEPATLGDPIGTARMRKTVAGGMLGLMLGVILAFVLDNLDTSVRTISEVEDIFQLSVVGVIPHFSMNDVSGENKRSKPSTRSLRRLLPLESLATLRSAFGRLRTSHASVGGGEPLYEEESRRLIVPFAPNSPASEAFRTLQTNLRIAVNHAPQKVIMVTSASPGEGKTSTLVNVAITFAQAGMRTLLVEADMRRPQIHRTFGLQRERGLAEILQGEIVWQEAVKDHADVALGSRKMAELATTPGMDNLSIITSGNRTTQPAELLAQPMFDILLKEWDAAYDVVLIDSPPVIPVPDSIIMAEKIRRVVLVYQQGTTARQMTQRAIVNLQTTGADILGIVLNDLRSYWVDPSESYRYKMYYGAAK
ncbi:MAG TPA: hypothetical protein DCS43_03100 [Verrucomicrobia bacterium]|nr:hypothetical protein [Verrucomicrobiota bacterium]